MRLRESAIVTILLLGLTGCAGVQPRLGWMQPSTSGAQDSEGRPLSRLAFWRHHSADDHAASTDETTLASNEESNSRPRLLRRLPVVSRFFKDDRSEESDDLGSPATRYARGLLSPPANAVATATPSPALAPSAARPIQTTSANVPNTDRPASSTLRELTVDLAGHRPDVDAATVPVRNPAAMPPPLQNTPSTSNIPAPPLAPATMPSLGQDNVPPPTAVPGPAPSMESPDLVPAPPSTPAAPAARPTTPSSSTPESQPAPKPAASETASPSPTVTSTPGPAWPVESSSVPSSVIGSFQSSGQSVVMPSAQGGYVSGGCESPCGAKCKIHKLCPLKKHKQMAAASVVMPSGQGSVSSCEATVPCKKECFLKKWLHHKSGCKLKGCKGCKSCAYCGEAPAMVSAQGPMVSSQW